jgi:hypothetical protein
MTLIIQGGCPSLLKCGHELAGENIAASKSELIQALGERT